MWDEHAGRDSEGVAVAGTVGELDDGGVEHKVPSYLGEVDADRAETAALLAGGARGGPGGSPSSRLKSVIHY